MSTALITLRQLLTSSPLPRSEMRILLAAATGLTATQIITHDDYQLTLAQLGQMQEWQQRRLAGEPIAYLLGYKEFYGRQFQVNQHTLIPRPETELLVEAVLSHAAPGARVLDCGTGSGCIAISISLERPDLEVVALDCSAQALKVAKANNHILSGKVHLLQSNWLAALAPTPTFDVIVANPPYIEAGDFHLPQLAFEPLTALTDFSDGLTCIRQLAAVSGNYLNHGGWLMLEHGYNQGANVRKILQAARFSTVITLQDYAGQERIGLGQYLNPSI